MIESANTPNNIENHIRQQLAQGAGAAKDVFKKIKEQRTDEEQEGFMDIIFLAAKVKANQAARRVLHHVRPRKRFAV